MMYEFPSSEKLTDDFLSAQQKKREEAYSRLAEFDKNHPSLEKKLIVGAAGFIAGFVGVFKLLK